MAKNCRIRWRYRGRSAKCGQCDRCVVSSSRQAAASPWLREGLSLLTDAANSWPRANSSPQRLLGFCQRVPCRAYPGFAKCARREACTAPPLISHTLRPQHFSGALRSVVSLYRLSRNAVHLPPFSSFFLRSTAQLCFYCFVSLRPRSRF